MPKIVHQMKKVLLPKLGSVAHFIHREAMKPRGVFRAFRHKEPIIPPTKLPVDSTGKRTVQNPMDANDTEGICGPAMCDKVDRIFAWRQGTGVQLKTDVAALSAQYLKVSGGDNGTDEAMLVGSGGIWRTGIAGDPAQVIVDALDIDVTNVPLTQFVIDNFYTVQMAWSVPDAFVNGFTDGSVWLNPGIPDPNNGHYTPLADVDASGNYSLLTWGAWCTVSPAFVASVQPQCFAVFSARQFSPTTGLDSKGRHVITQAALWEQCGGAPIPAAVLNAFPPIGGPIPVPVPTPNPGPLPVPVPVPVPAAFTLTFVRGVKKGQRWYNDAKQDIAKGKYGCSLTSSLAGEEIAASDISDEEASAE